MTTRSYVAELISTIKYYHLHDQYAETADILFMAEQGMLSESMAHAELFALEPDIEHAKDFPNFLHRPPTEEQFYADGKPDIEVGHMVQAEHIRFGVRLLDGPSHCLIAGRTKAGKTTLIRIMIDAVEALNARLKQEAD
ncbi:MAG TPA: hypothetical protein VMY35_06885 [Phycisphaerae bacterium]|nr:hypothetical protein [Phycisphaerae bacterium]